MGSSFGIPRRSEPVIDIVIPEEEIDEDVSAIHEAQDAENDLINSKLKSIAIDENILALDCFDPFENSSERERLRKQIFMKDIFPKNKKPRISKTTDQYWISPFERRGEMEPIIRANGSYSFRDDGTKHFPRFLHNYINKDLALHMRLRCMNAKPELAERYTEISVLKNTIKYVKVQIKQNASDQKISIQIEESHGKRKNTSRTRFRKMYVKFIILDHRNPSILISGNEFLLSLHPKPDKECTGQFRWKDDHGSDVILIGHYCRELDSNPNIVLEWFVSSSNYINRDVFKP